MAKNLLLEIFRKRKGRTSNIVDNKSKYRSHKEGVVLARIEYPGY